MKCRKINYISTFAIIFLAALFRVLLLLFSYFSIKSLNANLSTENKIPISEAINFLQIFAIVILLAESVCYIIFRKRYFMPVVVRWHIWMTLISSVLLPIVQVIVMAGILPSIYSPNELKQIIKTYEAPTLFFGWLLFAIARLFFIIAIRKSVTSLKEPEQKDEPTGFLDEFIN